MHPELSSQSSCQKLVENDDDDASLKILTQQITIYLPIHFGGKCDIIICNVSIAVKRKEKTLDDLCLCVLSGCCFCCWLNLVLPTFHLKNSPIIILKRRLDSGLFHRHLAI